MEKSLQLITIIFTAGIWLCFGSCHSFAINLNPLPDSGQTNCYNSSNQVFTCPSEEQTLYGQNGNYIIAPLSYNDNGDGTVTDLNTHLQWVKSTADTDNSGNINGNDRLSQPDAVTYCSNLQYATHDDWRLPDYYELLTIIDFSRGSGNPNVSNFPAIHPLFTPTLEDEYWSNTLTVNNSASWVDFDMGSAGSNYIGIERYIRCVRGDQTQMTQFVNNGDQTISDPITGLMWIQDDLDNSGTLDQNDTTTWASALSWCEQSDFAGYNDWRLPNSREMSSILNYFRQPHGDEFAAYFPERSLLGGWTSTTKNWPTHAAWTGSLSNNLEGGYKHQNYGVPCVRSEKVNLSVLFRGNGGGIVQIAPEDINCSQNCSEILAKGKRVTLTAIADNDSIFLGWPGTCEGTESCSVNMDRTRFITANFLANEQSDHKLTLLKTGNGTGAISGEGISCGDDCTIYTKFYENPASITLNTSTGNNSTFLGWSGDCEGGSFIATDSNFNAMTVATASNYEDNNNENNQD